MTETDVAVRTLPRGKPGAQPEQLRTAFPLPPDPRFDELLVALDRGFVPTRARRRSVHRGRPWRVLALAVLAVVIVLAIATAAAAAAWELAGERYVDEIVRETF
jgi:hypothetical protein